MRNILLGIVIAFVIVFGLRYCENKKENREILEANTALIQKELKNVGKLIVTEGGYAQVFTYNDSKDLMYGLFDARKKALIVINAKATIAYDLSEVKTDIDETTKTVTITNIPEPELSINPNIQYYDVTQDYLNQFTASDYNKIKSRVEKSLKKKIEASELRTNAENRLISELQKIYILTNSMGWTLKYNSTVVENEAELQKLKL
ncbi:DUF4230 domain-containing protein [Aequorivita vladivostokensis]|uniref:DUF4230 domain-containing protein n=1 Tax=Aequorivita vladivostokensis TaxID=171194 RepID=A0ABR5DMC9_9FLAO|nr:DUF4230 domain-containing protein [Aequorivita vladivostokensis]KJJ39923.1 hypothetical protein MB09_01825 [Aequorivita vladivostokensis]MAB56902.1 DUF4230 domain-containing protein [Aequorivita sp.]MBF30927.1 DUF4230 domain-containing protein [Aequorivita sp.]|tara:strand:- start:32475 stop:33089 length:615 start_codon:yes stop_codon:yes gene_type:complete